VEIEVGVGLVDSSDILELVIESEGVRVAVVSSSLVSESVFGMIEQRGPPVQSVESDR
jgi:hypothetical protein